MTRLLLVDDEPNVVSALKRVLRASFTDTLNVECFTDPNLALKRLRQASFDVVLSDYRMPEMNGLEFLRRVREIQPHVIRMILSASSDFSIIQQAINEVEVFRYLAKPWTESEFVQQISLALDRAEQTRTDRHLADAMRAQQGSLSSEELERRRLEELEPGITVVEWGPHGEILMPDGLIDDGSPPDFKPADR